ncbi:uncharacterized protein PV09_08320 [Verruconis gallopava]|uniref:Uncharacterized protein n=1 Tax=Verruconis gallopava TaxID=253628 RepID=A0A0D1YH46_9PEZI|nr:uncharacterized protein PV09_08320 [Verruconis gallopava]KIW00142.1 hypothetical protein PV09_08320 [Verruconis gallopava]
MQPWTHEQAKATGRWLLGKAEPVGDDEDAHGPMVQRLRSILSERWAARFGAQTRGHAGVRPLAFGQRAAVRRPALLVQAVSIAADGDDDGCIPLAWACFRS